LKRQHWILLGGYVALIVLLSFYHEMWRGEDPPALRPTTVNRSQR
jgi:hypothetical protein